jgi:hypothetical protein
MNKRDFVTQMRDHYLSQIPNLKSDFSIDSIAIEPRKASLRGFRDALRLPWRFALKLAIVALLGLFTFVLLSQTPTSTPTVLAEIDDIYAFQAISSTDLLFSSSVANTTPLSVPLSMQRLTTKPAIEDELDDLNKYLNMIEQFLGNDSLLTATVTVSDLPAYAFKLTYASVNLLGEAVSYTLYYNESPVDGSVIPDYEFTDEEDSQVVSVLDGMMTIGTVTYYLEGKRVIDAEDESEIILFRSFLDHDNYVEVRYQTDEDGEQKFFYAVVQSGVVLNRSKLRVSTEDDKIITELEFTEGSAKGKYTFRETTVEGIRIISVRYEIVNGDIVEKGEARVQTTTDAQSGITSYSYAVKSDDEEEEHQYEKEREEHGREDEEDREDDEEQGQTTTEVENEEDSEPGNEDNEPGNEDNEPGNEDNEPGNEQENQDQNDDESNHDSVDSDPRQGGQDGDENSKESNENGNRNSL